MKLFAQHGALCGERIDEGLKRKIIDGVIYSPRDISGANLKTAFEKVVKINPKADRLIDPQFYACFLASRGDSRLGELTEDYQQYFRVRSRSQLEREQAVNEDLARCLKFQVEIDTTAVIAPNIIIPRSFNSIEAVISKSFIRNAKAQYSKLKSKKPLFVTLAISRNALTDKQELQEFMNELTMMEDPPDGFYLIAGASGSDSRAEIFNADTIAAWMLINQSLSVNGYKVLNGFSDLMTPFLGAAGAMAGATGWFSNLRTFSMARFEPSGGGRLPVQRYLCNGLMNRITFTELDALRDRMPGILNKLPTDAIYDKANGSEPPRNQEVLQSWESIQALNTKFCSGNLEADVKACLAAVNKALGLYARIPIALDVKSNGDHIKALDEGLNLFADLAEIKLTVDNP